MTRKRKIALGALTLVVIFCLWYTRPRSFGELAGDGKITFVSMLAIKSSPPAGISAWGLDGDESRSEVIREAAEILESGKYRASLINLILFLPAPETTKKININVTQDNDSFWIDFMGSTAVFHFDEQEIVYNLNDSITEKLFAYTQEFGVKIENKS